MLRQFISDDHLMLWYPNFNYAEARPVDHKYGLLLLSLYHLGDRLTGEYGDRGAELQGKVEFLNAIQHRGKASEWLGDVIGCANFGLHEWSQNLLEKRGFFRFWEQSLLRIIFRQRVNVFHLMSFACVAGGDALFLVVTKKVGLPRVLGIWSVFKSIHLAGAHWETRDTWWYRFVYRVVSRLEAFHRWGVLRATNSRGIALVVKAWLAPQVNHPVVSSLSMVRY